MAKKSRMAVLKRQRELRKAEKAERKRARREQREPLESPIASREDLESYGVAPPEEEADSRKRRPPKPAEDD